MTIDIYLLAKILGTIVGILGSGTALWKWPISPVMRWFKNTNKLWNDIAFEFKPNGGSSMKDAITRIETRQLIKDQRDRALDNDTLYGIWEADETGRYTHVNRTYNRISGTLTEDLLNYGWINTIYPPDRLAITQEWELAREQHREFYGEYRIELPDGKIINVINIGHPLKDRNGNLKGYVGQLVVKGDSDDVFFSTSP